MSTRRLLAPADYRVMPWKNGLGTTLELAIEPPPSGPGLDPFLWRVSIATVASDGPFSAFPGYDRIILVLEGNGMALSHSDPASTRAPTRDTGPENVTEDAATAREAVVPPMQPYRFMGEWSTRCRLIEGPVLDLNVMTRRDAFAASLTVHHVKHGLEGGEGLELSAGLDLHAPARGVLLVYAAQGTAEALLDDGTTARLEPGHLLRIDAGPVPSTAPAGAPHTAPAGVPHASAPPDQALSLEGRSSALAPTARLSSTAGATLLQVRIIPAGP